MLLSAGAANADEILVTLSGDSPAAGTVIPFGSNHLLMTVDLFSLWGDNEILRLKFVGDPSGESLLPVALYSEGTQVGPTKGWFYSDVVFDLLPGAVVVPEGTHKKLELRAGLFNFPYITYPTGFRPRLNEVTGRDLATGDLFAPYLQLPVTGNLLILGTTATPEPGTVTLVAMGLALCGLGIRRH